jgi:hypothetical protein
VCTLESCREPHARGPKSRTSPAAEFNEHHGRQPKRRRTRMRSRDASRRTERAQRRPRSRRRHLLSATEARRRARRSRLTSRPADDATSVTHRDAFTPAYTVTADAMYPAMSPGSERRARSTLLQKIRRARNVGVPSPYASSECRGDRIRTCDPLVPKGLLYPGAPGRSKAQPAGARAETAVRGHWYSSPPRSAPERPYRPGCHLRRGRR